MSRAMPGIRRLRSNYIGKHYINAANTHSYGGHAVVNWRGGVRLGDRSQLFARIVNLFDKRYADRADFAFGNYRYFRRCRFRGTWASSWSSRSLRVSAPASGKPCRVP